MNFFERRSFIFFLKKSNKCVPYFVAIVKKKKLNSCHAVSRSVNFVFFFVLQYKETNREYLRNDYFPSRFVSHFSKNLVNVSGTTNSVLFL